MARQLLVTCVESCTRAQSWSWESIDDRRARERVDREMPCACSSAAALTRQWNNRIDPRQTCCLQGRADKLKKRFLPTMRPRASTAQYNPKLPSGRLPSRHGRAVVMSDSGTNGHAGTRQFKSDDKPIAGRNMRWGEFALARRRYAPRAHQKKYHELMDDQVSDPASRLRASRMEVGGHEMGEIRGEAGSGSGTEPGRGWWSRRPRACWRAPTRREMLPGRPIVGKEGVGFTTRKIWTCPQSKMISMAPLTFLKSSTSKGAVWGADCLQLGCTGMESGGKRKGEVL